MKFCYGWSTSNPPVLPIVSNAARSSSAASKADFKATISTATTWSAQYIQASSTWLHMHKTILHRPARHFARNTHIQTAERNTVDNIYGTPTQPQLRMHTSEGCIYHNNAYEFLIINQMHTQIIISDVFPIDSKASKPTPRRRSC